jgi:hypothetical protein
VDLPLNPPFAAFHGVELLLRAFVSARFFPHPFPAAYSTDLSHMKITQASGNVFFSLSGICIIPVGSIPKQQQKMLRFAATSACRRSVGVIGVGFAGARYLPASQPASSFVVTTPSAYAPAAQVVFARRLVSAKAAPTGPPSAERQKTPMEKLKAELWKALKMNLILLPIVAIFVLWMFPVVSPEEERKMLETYRKTAGWKT